MSDTRKVIERPLSPHLQVYRWQLTMAMSILHRITGAALAVGCFMVVWLLVATASGQGAYETFRTFAGSNLGMLLLFGWSVAMFYHLCNGIRHLLWDTGRLFALKDAYLSGYIVLIMTALLTVLFWCAVCPWKGE